MAHHLQAKLTRLLLAAAFVLAFQSCSDKNDTFSPRVTTSATTMNTGAAPASCRQACLVAGQHTQVGTVDVAVLASKDVQVTYSVTAPGVFLSEVHLDFFALDDQSQFRAAGKMSKGGAIPGKFAYKQSFSAASRTQTFSFIIPAGKLPEDCFSIAAHAALSNGETAWGSMCNSSSKGVAMDEGAQFEGKNWGGYFNFCKSECTQEIDFTYAWEDQRNVGNDGDYNDLVVQSVVTRSTSELTINFLATARGASFDHAFKFRISAAGIAKVAGVPQIFIGADPANITEDGGFYYVTMYPSTKTALPGTGVNGFANTVAADGCVTFPSKKVTIKTTPAFVYKEAKPYEPFISVYPSGNFNNKSGTFDLYIYEVSGRDTWLMGDQQFPNGILIPNDWKWPLERVLITRPYPSFTSLNSSGGFNPLWANNLAMPALTRTCE